MAVCAIKNEFLSWFNKSIIPNKLCNNWWTKTRPQNSRELSCCDGRHVTWPVDHSLIGLFSDRADSLMFPIFKMTWCSDFGVWSSRLLKQMWFKFVNFYCEAKNKFSHFYTWNSSGTGSPRVLILLQILSLQVLLFRLSAKYSLSCLSTKTLQEQTPKGCSGHFKEYELYIQTSHAVWCLSGSVMMFCFKLKPDWDRL